MKSNERKRAYAERLYIEDGWTAKSIATTVGVSENTVGAWIKKYKWKEKKEELNAAPHRVKKKILEEIQSVLDGGQSSFNADTLSKLTRAFERLNQQVSTQVVISVFKEYDNWLAGQDIQQDSLSEQLDLHKQFLQHRIESEQ